MMVSIMDTPQGEQTKHDTQTPVTESVESMAPDLIKEMGRQFVVQYYTVMNKCPENLHRFYKDDSYLIRGDPPARGQTHINEKIMTLGLKDCRAVVLQLDSLKSHKNSVVIQVTGEISNDGSEMRRFMQTFVLVEQAQGNFYVLNDIFRYQDEVYGDAIPNGADSNESSLVKNQDHSSENVYEPAYEIKPELTDAHIQPNGDATGNTSLDDAGFGSTVDVADVDYSREPIKEVNGKVDDYEDIPAEVIPEPMHDIVESHTSQPAPVEAPQVQAAVVEAPVKKPVQDGPLTWASLVGAGATPATQVSHIRSANSQQQSSRPPVHQNSKPAPAAASAQNQESRPQRNRNTSPSEGRVDGTASRSRSFPDNHQVFVGNLTPDITEDILREFFTKFGRVQEVRINKSKGNQPSFGFVVFDSPTAVKSVVNCKPLTLGNNHRLNVEEKKAQGGGGRSGGNWSRGGGGGGGFSDRGGRASVGGEGGRGGSVKRH